MRKINFSLGGLLAILFGFSAFSGAADLTGRYEWKPLKIGGGGWVTGMDISPSEKGLIYVRTDVSGAYRWDSARSQWKQIVTTSSMPRESISYGNYGGVDSLVSAPGDPNMAYMAFSGKTFGKGDGEIYKSLDRGENWISTHFRVHKVSMEANGSGRQVGERLAVDPQNSNVVYFGSVSNGLWKTLDGGAAWTRVDAIPAGTPEYGITTVVFDPQSGVTEAKTNRIYVTVEDGGVFKSSDAGATWVNIASEGPKNSGKARDAETGPDRTYYVAFDDDKGAVGSVWKYSLSGTWTEITPQDAREGGSKAYWDLAIDPADANHLVVMCHGGKTFVSTDQGKSWTFHMFKLSSPVVEWQGRQANYFLSMGEILFDPFEPGKLWFAEGFGVWWANNLTTSEIEWNSVSQGVEEACGNDVIAPPDGHPVAAMWDLGAFYFRDPDIYSALKSHPGFMSCWALDWCPADPKFVVGVFRSHLDFVPFANSTGYSTDGGQTWTRFPAVEKKAIPKELEYGVIAVSANSTDKIVWCPANRVLPYYSADRGNSWKKSSLEGLTLTGLKEYPQPSKPLCADRVQEDTFYFYSPEKGVLRSTDGGATFSQLGHPAPGGAYGGNGILKSTPGRAGHLWFAEGLGLGAFRSIDGGANWAGLSGIKTAYNIGLGKAREEGGYPTIFVAGVDTEERSGIFRSVDEGKTWDRIAVSPLGVTDYIDALDGDKDEFGKIYLGFACAGFAYGEEKPAEKIPPSK